MESFEFGDLSVILNKEGSPEFTKVSYPIRYGRYGEIRTEDHVFQFNLNGEVKQIGGRSRSWPHPAEWLKRTMGNDWIYYSSGNYRDIYDLYGEYYLPCPSYPSNAIFDGDPFDDPTVRSAINSCRSLKAKIDRWISCPIPQNFKEFLIRVAASDGEALVSRTEQLHRFIGGEITVLPPDTRHVDYDAIPVIIADGCLYDCGFCRVKSGRDFAARTREKIKEQIRNLKGFFGEDLPNYNAIFLGQHDALHAGRDLIGFAAEEAYQCLGLERSYLRGSFLFLFGSVGSLLRAEEALFDCLNRMPYSTYINVGLESGDRATLSELKKPITVEMVREAFERMVDINGRYERVEVTANFVLGDGFAPGHMSSIIDLTRNRVRRSSIKGTIYLSPLTEEGSYGGANHRQIVSQFTEVKRLSHFPTFLYLIQRL